MGGDGGGLVRCWIVVMASGLVFGLLLLVFGAYDVAIESWYCILWFFGLVQCLFDGAVVICQ